MFHVIKPGTKFDFMGKAPLFTKVSVGLVTAALLVIGVFGLNFGLDFSGGHEILLRFDKQPTAADVRGKLEAAFPGVDNAVQSFEVPTEADKTFYLVRLRRSESFGQNEIDQLNKGFKDKYGETFKKMRYNPEAGDVVEVEFAENATAAADLSDAALSGVVAATGHEVRLVKRIGRKEQMRWSIVLTGVDATVVNAMKALDDGVDAVRVEFVGPTVGKQLRDQGILAVLYALLFIMVYIALRFDFFYSPGAILCLFHDAIITVALLALAGQQFTLATIAGLLTLVGYSINDTIVVFDRIRETVGKAQGSALDDILNRAINETLGRTIMTSLSTLAACICLIVFGAGTVLAEFGIIMTVGIVIGTYSSVYVASPAFRALRLRFGPKENVTKPKAKRSKAETAVV
ncbi:MAG: protein translocase subunit SecF [Deltaproteobacteria bacterium]